MDRYLEVAHSATPPSAPPASSGYPTNGNPQTATPATEPGEWWFHMITEEIRNVIAAAGITPNHAAVNQLAAAIQQLIISGGAVKTPVRVTTTVNIASLAGGAPNTLDGVALAASDRILVKNQTTGSENGIYVVTTLGTGANGTWTRATDADGVGELTTGMLVAVSEGNTYPDTVWELATNGTITIGATSLTFQWAGGLVGLTQAQFDNSTKLATTGFVKRQGVEFSNVATYVTPTTLTAASAGQFAVVSISGGGTITLPSAAAFASGATITFQANGANQTIARAGSDLIYMNSGTTVTSLTLGDGDTLTLVSNGGSNWSAFSGSKQIGYSAAFGSSLGVNGYQKLPSGLIVQWGQVNTSAGGDTAVTFPIAFPSIGYSLVGSVFNNTTNGSWFPAFYNFTTTGFSASAYLSTTGARQVQSVSWIALGK